MPGQLGAGVTGHQGPDTPCEVPMAPVSSRPDLGAASLWVPGSARWDLPAPSPTHRCQTGRKFPKVVWGLLANARQLGDPL